MKFKSSVLRLVVLVAITLSLIGCFQRPRDISALKARVASGSGRYNGVWNSSLTITRDTCGLGLTSPFAVAITIKQNGNKAKVSFLNLPSYKGTIDSKGVLSANGKYSGSGLKTNGTVRATLKSKTKLKIAKSTINVTAGTTHCAVTFKGSGTKA